MKKYGVSYSTIRYFQTQARNLVHYNGIRVVGYLRQSGSALQRASARQIAHDAIGAAFVHTATELRNLLTTGDPELALIDGFTTRNGIIQTPGQFEGESVATLYFWDRSLDGGADETIYDGEKPYDVFLPDAVERERFKLLGWCYVVSERESGF